MFDRKRLKIDRASTTEAVIRTLDGPRLKKVIVVPDGSSMSLLLTAVFLFAVHCWRWRLRVSNPVNGPAAASAFAKCVQVERAG